MLKKIICFSNVISFGLLIIWVSIFNIIDIANPNFLSDAKFFLFVLFELTVFLIPIIYAIIYLKDVKNKVKIAIFCLNIVDNLLLLYFCIYLLIHHVQKNFWSYITIPHTILFTLSTIACLVLNIYTICKIKSSHPSSMN